MTISTSSVARRYSSLDLLDEGSVVAGTHSKWTFVKLDDPDGPLDGPGHVISDEEFFPEMLLCDGQRNRRKHLLFVDDFTSFRDKDETKLRELERVGMAYGDLQIDAIFAFDERENGVLQAHVRADDRVKVLLEVVKPFRELMKLSGQPQPPPDDPRFDVPRPGTERQWMRVVAVTTDGMVVAWPRPSGPDGTRDTFMFKPRIRYDKMVYFPADNIMCMMRGENW